MNENRLKTLISEEALRERVTAMGKEIRAHYGDMPITVIGVLKGSFIFMADLIRAIGGDVKTEFLGVSSYHGGTRSTGVVKITQDLHHPIEGQHCLLVEDIVDTGLTVSYLYENLATRQPASLKIAALLHKPARTRVPVEID